MRKILVCLTALLGGAGATASAQDNGQTLRGVYAPVQTWPTAPGKGKAANPTLQAPDNGPIDGGGNYTIPQDVRQGTTLPGDVHPTPIAGRPGYGAAVVNGKRVIVDLNSNRVFQTPD